MQNGITIEVARLGIHVGFNPGRHRFFDDLGYQSVGILGFQHFIAVAINDSALLVHHVIVLQHPFTGDVVAMLDFFLGILNRPIQQGVLEFLAFLQAKALHHFGHAL